MPLEPARPFAVISQVRGCAIALDAVLEHIAEQGVTQIVSLGGLVGLYGDPVGCLERAAAFALCLRDVRDGIAAAAPGSALPGVGSATGKAMFPWTRAQLVPPHRATITGWPTHAEFDGLRLYTDGEPADGARHADAPPLTLGHGPHQGFSAHPRATPRTGEPNHRVPDEPLEGRSIRRSNLTDQVVFPGFVADHFNLGRARYVVVTPDTVAGHEVPYDAPRVIAQLAGLGVIPDQNIAWLRRAAADTSIRCW